MMGNEEQATPELGAAALAADDAERRVLLQGESVRDRWRWRSLSLRARRWTTGTGSVLCERQRLEDHAEVEQRFRRVETRRGDKPRPS